MTITYASPSELLPEQQWIAATWQDYLAVRDRPDISRAFYNDQQLWYSMGSEGINHAGISDLYTSLFLIWYIFKNQTKLHSLGRCQLERDRFKAAAPDLVVYAGDDYPRWRSGDRRFINLDKARVPDLVGEISDTTLADDLDGKKHLYASLGINEYWVLDVQGRRIFAFLLQADGTYAQTEESQLMPGLAVELLVQALVRLESESNSEVAAWFSQQLQQL